MKIYNLAFLAAIPATSALAGSVDLSPETIHERAEVVHQIYDHGYLGLGYDAYLDINNDSERDIHIHSAYWGGQASGLVMAYGKGSLDIQFHQGFPEAIEHGAKVIGLPAYQKVAATEWQSDIAMLAIDERLYEGDYFNSFESVENSEFSYLPFSYQCATEQRCYGWVGLSLNHKYDNQHGQFELVVSELVYSHVPNRPVFTGIAK
jgi:hypothetical protein